MELILLTRRIANFISFFGALVQLGIEEIILPLLSGMSDGLDAFLSILTFDLDAILQVLDDLFGIQFPFLSDIAEMLDFENPIEPWLDSLRDFAGDFEELIDNALAMPLSIINAIDTLTDKFKIGNIFACSGSSSPEALFECMYSKLGIGPPPDLFGALDLDFLEMLMFDDSFADALYDILISMEGCAQYDEVNIPYDKLLEDAGIILPEPRCEITIPGTDNAHGQSKWSKRLTIHLNARCSVQVLLIWLGLQCRSITVCWSVWRSFDG